MTENRSMPRKRRALVEVTVVKVSPYLRAEKPLMWLSEKEAAEPRLLPIAVGEFEAAAIQMQLSGERPLRPISYDLFASFLDELSVPVRRVVIHSVKGQVFHAVSIVEREGLVQESDEGKLGGIIDAVLADNPEQVAQFKAGKTKVVGFLVGQVMKETGGKANPQVVNQLLSEKLGA